MCKTIGTTTYMYHVTWIIIVLLKKPIAISIESTMRKRATAKVAGMAAIIKSLAGRDGFLDLTLVQPMRQFA